MKSCEIKNGPGRFEDNLYDRFVLTRVLNQPELVFNHEKCDKAPKNEYFKKDADAKWKLSKKNECFICDGHKFVIIFYERPVDKNDT